MTTSPDIPIPFESYSGSKPFAFVSYAHADKVLVYNAMRHFHEANLNLWYDDGIPPAEEWQNEIAQKIMGSDMFAVFLSPSACSSSHVNREIQFALSENKPMLPIFLEDITLTPSLKLCLQQFQSCFYYKLGWQKKAIEVMRNILAKADSQGQHRHLLNRKSTGEEVLDEGEALWKIMEQVFAAQVNRYSRQNGSSSVTEGKDTEDDKEKKAGFSPVIPVPQRSPAKPKALSAQKTRHPFAVGVIVDEAENNIRQDKPPFSDSYVGDLSWIPSGKITVRVPYTSDVRLVHVRNDFWLSQLLVTQEVYTEVMGSNPSDVDTDGGAEVFNLPVNRVSWLDAVEFCKALTVLAKDSGSLPENHEFRLPTEVEWEYACRAGTTTDYYFGDDPAELHEHGWYLVNSVRRVHPVKLKLPNPWGLHDMYGNVREWVGNSFVNTLLDDTEQDEFRICRGGSYMKKASGCKSSSRDTQSLFHRYRNLGFRVALARLPNT
ncbi:MAG: SUMF1/EgtB/PvdO family nonheme iron enzyme [Opitutae bacterium]|nr:SUMF1/EgtB/PvdO family nonheme iron enzyme [Opitutae bacterium]